MDIHLFIASNIKSLKIKQFCKDDFKIAESKISSNVGFSNYFLVFQYFGNQFVSFEMGTIDKRLHFPPYREVIFQTY